MDAGTIAEPETRCAWNAFSCETPGQFEPLGHMLRNGIGSEGTTVEFSAQALAVVGNALHFPELGIGRSRSALDVILGGPNGPVYVKSRVSITRHCSTGV